MNHRTACLGLILTMMVLVGVFSTQPLTRVSAQKDEDPSLRAAYENEEIFNQLSSAAQMRLERMFGKKGASVKEASSPPAPFGSPSKPLEPHTALAQPLVNNPAADTTSRDTQSETTIVLGSGMNLVAAFNDSGSNVGGSNHFVGFSTSANMGTSWTDRGTLPASTPGDGGDPVLASSTSTGTIFLATLGFSSDDVLQIFRSTDNGATFAAPINGAPGSGGASDMHDKEWIAVDNFAGTGQGNVYMGWRDFGSGGGMLFTRSTNNGLTWGPNNGLTIEAGGGQGAFVAVAPDHTVYYWWFHSASNPDEIRVCRSTDFGSTFSSPSTVTPLLTTGTNGDLGVGIRSNAFPHAAVNPVNGQLYVVYPDNPAGADRADVFFKSSTDNGASWPAATRVNTDAGTNDNWSPTIAVTPNGSALSITWYDRRSDPANSLIQRWGVTATVSGGVITFGSNFRISDSFPVAVNQDPGIVTNYMGDYDQMVADNSFFYHTWGDNRLGNAIHAHQPDVRFAKFPIGGIGPLLDLVPPPTVSGGNGDGSIDPDECNDITIKVMNNGGATATMVTGTLSTSTPGVTVFTPNAAYPDIPPGGMAANLTPFQISTAPGFVCGTPVQLTLTLNYAGGSDVVSVTLQSGVLTRFDSADVPKPINDMSTITSVINVTGLTAPITKVTVSLQATHAFCGDLDIALIAPDGTTIDLSSDNGSSNDNYGAACAPDASRTTFDDDAATAITAAPNSSPFAVGSFRPEQALTVFNGMLPGVANGTWTLRIIDDESPDAGTLNCWTLNFSPFNCSPGGGECVCVLTCPSNVTQSNDPNQCGALVNYPNPTSTGCGTITCSPAAGSFFPVGTTTVTCTESAKISCSFTVTVNDAQPPAITCPANITRGNDPNQCGAAVNYSNATATDNCPGVGTPLCSPASGSFFPVGTTTVTCTVNDAAANQSSCTFTIRVNDTQPPSITCPANVTRGNDPNQCGAVVKYPNATAMDNCPGVGTPLCSPAAGSFFPVGTTTVTCTVSDAAANQSSCSFTVTVNDTQPPSITCPANVTTSNAPNQCGAVVNYPNATATDNCPGVGTPLCSPASGSFFPVGTTTVTCTVSDAAGNQSSCTFTIRVNDTQPPQITCPPNQTAVTDQNACTGTVCRVVNFPPPVASDNCPGVTVVCNPPAGACFPIGVTTVTCTATDTSGNTATCSFTVTLFDVMLQDDSDPTIVLLWNSFTGQYRFCCKGVTYTGIGKATTQGCVFTLQHNPLDRRVLGRVDKAVHSGNASIQAPPGTTRCTITDRNTLNDTPTCQ